MNFKEKFLIYSQNVNDYLSKYMDSIKNSDKLILDSMKYSLLSGGKRVRPVIFLAFNEMLGGENNACSYKISCSIEMIHTYSLIHDDLPCMDNSNMRRGKPSNHVVYGENMAVLTGDALLTQAFENLVGAYQVDCKKRLKMIEILSKTSGSEGMVLGQVLDINELSKSISDEKIINVYKKKTGMLFSASCQMGAILAGADEDCVSISGKIGEDVGVMFQLIDDILDVSGQSKIMGKNTGTDMENSKYTFVTKNGVKSAKKFVNSLSLKIKSNLKKLGCEYKFLSEFVDYLENRVS